MIDSNNRIDILIVEDSLTQAVQLRQLLESNGYEVRQAANGLEGIKQVSHKKPALIVSDVVMPKMDGFEFCNIMKNDAGCKDIPFILLTLLTDVNDIIRALESKADLYIPKPYDEAFLLDKINYLLTSGARIDNDADQETIELDHGGVRHLVRSSFPRITDLLLCTYETAVQKNQELTETQDHLSDLNLSLQRKVHELAASEDRFRALVLTVPDIVYRIDSEGKFVFINNAVRQLGYEADELIGEHFSRIMLLEDVLRTSRDKVLPACAGKVMSDKESPKLFDERRTGSRMTTGLEVRLVSKTSGRDIPGLIEKLSDDLVVVEINSSGIYEFDPGKGKQVPVGTVGIIRDISERKLAEEELKKAYGEVRHKNIELNEAQKELTELNRRLEELVKERTRELQLELAERKKTEQELKKSEEAYRTVADFTYAWEYWLLPDGSMRYVSPSCELHTGYRAAEFLQDPQLNQKIIHPDDRALFVGHLSVVHDAQPKGHTNELLFRIVTKSGEERWIAHICQPVYSADGKFLGQRASNNDVTERKKSEDERNDLTRQLYQAQKMESLGVLAGGIAHDFNNILAVIMCHTSLAQQKPEKAAEFMLEIEKTAERAAGLCKQMLSYAGKTQFVESNVDVKVMVDDMLGMLKSTLSRNICIEHCLEEGLPCIKADASQLRQIVMNLIINASEAIGEAEGNIRVALSKTTINAEQTEKDHLGKTIKPGRYLCLEVSDTGCGMSDETKQRLFEPFYTTKFVGRGLGMSAVLGIITSHKGVLQLFSQPGHGTTFKIYFPARDIEVAEEPASPKAQLLWRGSGTILFAEDEPQLLSIGKELLQELGFSVIGASDGIEALEEYRKNAEKIRMVVTDIGMPRMGGYQLIDELKKLDPSLPIIVSSGFGDAVVTSKTAPGDIAGLISKPYSFDQLREVLKGVAEGADPEKRLRKGQHAE